MEVRRMTSILVCVLLWTTFQQASCTLTKGFTSEPDWQAKCLESQNCMPEYSCSKLVGEAKFADGSWPVCLDSFRQSECLVYSFGVATDWSFDQQMGAFGCEVHSFDPTVDLPEKLAPNVTFHKWGLKGAGKTVQSNGPMLGPLYTLSEVRHRLGHHRGLSVLKMDCEGCEWGGVCRSEVWYQRTAGSNCSGISFQRELWHGGTPCLAQHSCCFPSNFRRSVREVFFGMKILEKAF